MNTMEMQATGIAPPTIAETAILVNGTEGWVRSMCSRGKFADCYTNGKVRHTYTISPGMLAQWLGISVEELSRRLIEIREWREQQEEEREWKTRKRSSRHS